MINARQAALETLMRVLNQQSYSNLALNQTLQKHSLSQKDQSLATRLVYGTIQYQLYLDYQLKDLIHTKLKEAYLRPLLLMSAYQIFFLTKIPDRAVLDEANKLAKRYGRQHSNGYRIVNGILHALLRRGEVLPDPQNRLEYLSVHESMPLWLLKYFQKNFGWEKTKAIAISCNQPAYDSVRLTVPEDKVMPVLTELGYHSRPSLLSEHNLLLDHGGIAQTALFEDGWLTIQDESASLAVDCFDFSGNDCVLDACSAPGGKTAQIAEKLTNGSVWALDLHPKKLRLVQQNARRLHVAARVHVKAMDARKCQSYFSEQQFDKILVDAPCSGLGLLRRKPEIRYLKRKEDILRLAQVQNDILEAVAPLLKKNGQLIYSTCTLAPEENDQVVQHFLKKHPQFELVPIRLPKIRSEGTLQIFPDTAGSDGFFIAKLSLRG